MGADLARNSSGSRRGWRSAVNTAGRPPTWPSTRRTASAAITPSYIQTAATIGFFLSLAVIGATRTYYGPEGFKEFGWRIPFLLSFILLGVSIYMRLRMEESPVFAKLRSAGKVSKNPIKESFGNRKNLKYVLLALFGATAGQGVVWYCGQFYALTFLQKPLNLSWQLVVRAGGHRAGNRHSEVHLLWQALGSHRPQEGNDDRLLPRRR